jgi:hypothetical protein
MAKLNKREKELMLSMGVMIVKVLEETVERAEKENIGWEFVPGIKLSIQMALGILKEVNEKTKVDEPNGKN